MKRNYPIPTRIVLAFLTILISFFDVVGQSNEDLLDNYLSSLKGTMHGASTSKDVDQLLSLYDENIVYEHPKFGMRIEPRSKVEEGITSFLSGYGGNLNDVSINVSNQIIGPNVISVEFEITFLTKDNTEVKRNQIQVLEVNNGKVKRIIDYW